MTSKNGIANVRQIEHKENRRLAASYFSVVKKDIEASTSFKNSSLEWT